MFNFTSQRIKIQTMRTLIILSALLPTLLLGQITNHFTHSDAQWNVAKTFIAATQEHPSFVATTTTVYGFQGDSTINGETWYKMYSTPDSLFQNNLVYQGLTRNENDVILFIDTLSQLDTLYNFNLILGDSVLYNFNGMPEWIYVDEINTLQINGQSYRKFKFTDPTGPSAFYFLKEEWIEGIGSIHGPLFPHAPVQFSSELPDSLLLTCSFSNTQDFFQHPSYSNCYVNIVLGTEVQETMNYKLYPNPASSVLTIEASQNLGGDIEIFDLNGKLVKTVSADGMNLEIDVSSLENGLYFLHFTTDKQINVKRFVVEK